MGPGWREARGGVKLGGESPGRSSEKREEIAMCGEKARSSSPGASPDKNQMNVLPLTVVRRRWMGGGGGKVRSSFFFLLRRVDDFLTDFALSCLDRAGGQSGDCEIRLDLIAKARPVSPVVARQNSLRSPDPRPHCSGRLSLRAVNW